MKQITQFPRIPFAVLPTPLYKLEAISREYGKNIYIKRDDMIGVALGGNKVRKLEFLLADAQANGADVVLTAGGPQSNHAMLTAACAAKLGMKAILVLKKRGELAGGNQILDRIYGADVRFVDTDTYDDVYAEMERIRPISSPWADRCRWARSVMSTAQRKLPSRHRRWASSLTALSAPPVPAEPMPA